ncbi:MAG: SurA N-terminal domain-containing protein, partial [Candidatus Adiutrix sp.]|nr:SurA N-terminal domain-containing protein [Candidatus Adiutrix sp.]
MLAYIRKNADSAVVWLIIGAIALVFVFFGLGRPGGSIAFVTVNGEEADPHEYQELVREANSRLRTTGQSSPDDDRYARMAALNEQISRILTRQFGENIGLRPGPRALREAVAAIEHFQIDGRFSLERYQAALAAQRRSASDFERDLRRNLTSERAVSLVLGLARAFQPELREQFHFQEDRVRFDYLFLADEDCGWDPKPTDEDLAAYYAPRREKWRRPAEMTIQYVEIIPADYQGDPTSAELEDYYDHNRDRFFRPEAVEARQILVSFPSLSPGEADKEATLDKAEAIRLRLEQGADFAALARELSDDRATSENGGALGFLTR